jgi:hypothetical protein
MAHKKQIPIWKDLALPSLKPAFEILRVEGKSERADVFRALRASLALYEVKKHRQLHLRRRATIKISLNKISKALGQINLERTKIYAELRGEMQPFEVRQEQAEHSFCDSFGRVMDVYVLMDQEPDLLVDRVLKARTVIDDFSKSITAFIAESTKLLPAKQSRSTGNNHNKTLVCLVCTVFDLWFRPDVGEANFTKLAQRYKSKRQLPPKTIAYNEEKINFVRTVFDAAGLHREFGSVRDEQTVQTHTLKHIKLRIDNPSLELFIHQQRHASELDSI